MSNHPILVPLAGSLAGIGATPSIAQSPLMERMPVKEHFAPIHASAYAVADVDQATAVRRKSTVETNRCAPAAVRGPLLASGNVVSFREPQRRARPRARCTPGRRAPKHARVFLPDSSQFAPTLMLTNTLLAACSFLAQEARPQAPPESEFRGSQRAAYEILDAFDALDTSRLPFVRVRTGRWSQQDGGPREWEHRFGFLLTSTRNGFTVRYTDLDTECLDPRGQERGDRGRATFEPYDLRRFAAERAEALRDPQARGERGRRNLSKPEAIEIGHAMMVSRACARRGFVPEANALWEAIGAEYREKCATADYPAYGLAQAIADQLARDFLVADYSWHDLLARHERWLDTFVDHFHPAPVADRAREIRSVIESATHSPDVDADHDSIPALLRELRNDRHVEFGDDAWVIEVAAPDPRPEPTPMDRLAAAGLDAAPALIEALDDRSLTRTITFSPRFGGGYLTHEYRDLAHAALVRILGPGAGHGQEPKRAWTAWYDTVRRDGLRDALVERMRRPDESGYGCARAYLDRWPDDPAPVLELHRERDDEGWRLAILSLLADRSRAPEIEEELRRESQHGDTEEGRILAADALLDRGSLFGARQLLRDLGELESESAWDARLGVLVRCGDPEIWSSVREAVARAAAHGPLLRTLQMTTRAELSARTAPGDRPALEEILRALLVDMLAYRQPGATSQPCHHAASPVVMHCASSADLAASMLAAWWPQEASFEMSRTWSFRVREITALENRMLSRRGRAPVALPEVPVAPETPDALRADLTEILATTTGATSQTERVRSSGVAALPALLAALVTLPSDHPRRDLLVSLAHDASNAVAHVGVDTAVDFLSHDDLAPVLALEGKVLTADALIECMITLSKTSAMRGRAAILRLERPGNGAGTQLTLLTAPEPSNGVSGFSIDAVSEGASIGRSGVTFTQSTIDRPSDLADHGLAQLRQGLAVGPAHTVEIILRLHH